MWHKTIAALALSQFLSPLAVHAAATWPSDIDEIEDLMFLQSGRNAPQFGSVVTPATKSINNFNLGAGFLRVAFHDMAAYNKKAGTNGLDASIGFELGDPYNTHNAGPAFNASINYYYDFFNSKASYADLIAVGTYVSVRSAGGPQIPMRAGRIDATGPGPNSLPDAADNASTLVGRFDKMGFTTSEMIQMVACGHTLGGLHPHVNPKNSKPEDNGKDYQPFDTTDGGFDNRVATEYVSKTTKNPLVVGVPGLNSDLTTYSADGNVTIGQLAKSNNDFNGACQKILQRMLECVPSNVKLSDEIVAYDVKPYRLNLNVIENGAALLFSGEIRVRTTLSTPSSVTLTYAGRSGDSCGSNCTITTKVAGTANGFDDQFTFYGFNARVTSISSFSVSISGGSGGTQSFSNNGKGFPVNDNAFVMLNGSTLSGSSFKPVIAVRAGQSVPTLSLSAKTAKVFNKLSTISKTSISLTKICGDDSWTYYSGSATLSSTQIQYGKLDLSLGGSIIDGFRTLSNFQSSGVLPKCGGKNTTSTTTTQSKTSSSSSTLTSSTLTTTSKTSSSLTTTTSSVSSTKGGISTSSTTESTTKGGKTSSTTTESTTKGGKPSSTTTTESTTKGGKPSSTTTASTTESTTESTTKDGIITSSTTESTTESTTTTSDEAGVTSSTTTKKGEHGGDDTTTPVWTPPADDWTRWDPAPVPTTTAKGGSDYTLPAWNNYKPPHAGDAFTSVYQNHYNEPAANGGSDGGNKNIEGLNLYIVVQIITPVFAAPTAVGDYKPGQIKYTPVAETWAPVYATPEKTWANGPAPTGTWGPADVPVAPSESASTWATAVVPAPSWVPADVHGDKPKPSATKTGPVGKWTGAANSLVARGETVMMGAAAVAGVVAYLL